MDQPLHRPGLGILYICIAVCAISVNDMLIKALSGAYPLHQMVFIRSLVGLVFTLGIVQLEGGFGILRTDRPWVHLARAMAVVVANMTFYAAVVVMPLGQATALFFVAPLLITLLSIPFLGEQVGIWRWGAVCVGFAGVLVMYQPWQGGIAPVLLLPVAAALFYALMQVLTRKLGVRSRASALAAYIQVTFIIVSLGFYVVAGDGRYAQGLTDESLVFLLRAWVWPTPEDWRLFLVLGLFAGAIGYFLGSAYRIAPAAVVAPFEYVGLPLALFWGWWVFGEWPTPSVWAGCALILGAGLVVFLREQMRAGRGG